MIQNESVGFDIRVRENDDFAIFVHKAQIGWRVELWLFNNIDSAHELKAIKCTTRHDILKEIELVVFPRILIELGFSPLDTCEIKLKLLGNGNINDTTGEESFGNIENRET